MKAVLYYPGVLTASFSPPPPLSPPSPLIPLFPGCGKAGSWTLTRGGSGKDGSPIRGVRSLPPGTPLPVVRPGGLLTYRSGDLWRLEATADPHLLTTSAGTPLLCRRSPRHCIIGGGSTHASGWTEIKRFHKVCGASRVR
uniref:Uncharacterized protein n=1 Tax=Knipowitschia caucasica TaxID=637954 RepID=A0AAV2KGE4_KNICA